MTYKSIFFPNTKLKQLHHIIEIESRYSKLLQFANIFFLKKLCTSLKTHCNMTCFFNIHDAITYGQFCKKISLKNNFAPV